MSSLSIENRRELSLEEITSVKGGTGLGLAYGGPALQEAAKQAEEKSQDGEGGGADN